ncbi:hypothetical protein ACHAWF_003879 [Thalassiosira exigua]
MYTNIDTDHALSVISTWLGSLDLLDGFPLGGVKEAMVIVMKNNSVEWGDIYFLQLLGTAIGTFTACMWAMIYYAVHEMGLLIPKHTNTLLIFCGLSTTWLASAGWTMGTQQPGPHSSGTSTTLGYSPESSRSYRPHSTSSTSR